MERFLYWRTQTTPKITQEAHALWWIGHIGRDSLFPNYLNIEDKGNPFKIALSL